MGAPTPARARGALRRALIGGEELIERTGHRPAVLDVLTARRMSLEWRRERRWRREDPRALARHERRVFSQNGEDGTIAELFSRLGTTNRFFVEIGAADGTENCTRLLAEAGSSGVWVEADPAKSAASRLVAGPRVLVRCDKIRRDNAADLLRAAAVPQRFDLLVVDIDGNDWWVLDVLLGSFRPRVVVVEYNATFHPGQWWVLPYRADRRWDGTFRHGASLTAMAGLAADRGLTLVGCDSHGVNAFFVATDEAGRSGVQWAGDVRRHYVGPWFSRNVWGHPRVAPGGRSMPAMTASEVRRVSVTNLRRVGPRARPDQGEPVVVSVRVNNGSRHALSSDRPAPVHLGVSWRSVDGTAIDGEEPRRAALSVPVPPGQHRRATVWIPAPDVAGSYQLAVTLVQETVVWLDTRDPGGVATLTVTVAART